MVQYEVDKYYKAEDGQVRKLVTSDIESQYTYIEEEEKWINSKDLHDTAEDAKNARNGVYLK